MGLDDGEGGGGRLAMKVAGKDFGGGGEEGSKLEFLNSFDFRESALWAHGILASRPRR